MNSTPKITMVSAEKLIPYTNNAKIHDQTQINNVAESIKQYGFINPIVLDKDNVIIAGHCRFMASKQLGLKEIPCIYADELTDEQIKAYRIIDNKTNESPWDLEMLNIELPEIDLTGFELYFDLPDYDDNELNESDLDEEFEKSSVTVTMKISSIDLYDDIKNKINDLCKSINATISVKMS